MFRKILSLLLVLILVGCSDTGETLKDSALEDLIITSQTLEGLNLLLQKKKFVEERFYPGAPSEVIRRRAELATNAMIRELLAKLPVQPRKSFVLSTFKKHLHVFDLDDTEERERAAAYCEQIMDILGIESSDGVLNTWLYGFDPNKLGKE